MRPEAPARWTRPCRGEGGGTLIFGRNFARGLTVAKACKWVAAMFREAVKILRALLSVVVLMLIIGGGHAVGAEPKARGSETSWGPRKNAKSAAMLSARAGVVCPLALVAEATGGRIMFSASAVLFCATANIEAWCEAIDAARAVREPERQSSARARPGVVLRLRI